MIYKTINGFPNYEINILGDVRNKRTGRVLKRQVRDKYYTASLYLNGKRSCKKLHRLIAEHFIPPPSKELIEKCKTIYPYIVCINHKDGNKFNNDISNLEWCSHIDNSKHAWDTGLNVVLRGELNGRTNLTDQKVHLICKFYEGGGTPKEAQGLFGISKDQSTKIRAGAAWKHVWGQYSIKVNHRKKKSTV